MQVLTGPAPDVRLEGPTVVTIGVFDGVHRGHQAVLGRAVELAAAEGMRPIAVTFDRHPREVLTPGAEPPLLTTLERKIALIEAFGFESLFVLRFDAELASWPAERFVERVLVGDLGARRVVVGSNFTFGHRALGTLALLRGLGERLGFEADGVPLLEIDGRQVSSSGIRASVAAGELAWPARALGRPFAVDGTVVTGAGRGVGLGFPTANLEVAPRMLLPRQGVYAGRALARGEGHAAAIDVGTNPTFGEEPLHVEAFLLDFDGDLRGAAISVEFWERLRDEVRFDHPDDLVRQMQDDAARTRALVREPGGQGG